MIIKFTNEETHCQRPLREKISDNFCGRRFSFEGRLFKNEMKTLSRNRERQKNRCNDFRGRSYFNFFFFFFFFFSSRNEGSRNRREFAWNLRFRLRIFREPPFVVTLGNEQKFLSPSLWPEWNVVPDKCE